MASIDLTMDDYADCKDFARGLPEKSTGARSYLITFFDDDDTSIGSVWKQWYVNGELSKFTDVFDFVYINEKLATAFARRKTPLSVKHCSWQFEQCPTTERIHAHLAITFSDPVTFLALQKHVWPQYKANDYLQAYKIEGAIKYCTKDDSRIAGPWEYGVMDAVGQGKRSDIKAACDMIKEAVTEGLDCRRAMKRAADAFPDTFVKYSRGLDDYVNIICDRDPSPSLEEVILCVGESGSGKSHFARAYCSTTYARAYVKNSNNYFDGYNNHEALFFDEFTGQMPYNPWKNLVQLGAPNEMEGGEARFTLAQSKPGGIAFGSRVIIFATNKLPTRWWDLEKLGESTKTLKRRFSKIIWFGGEYLEGTAWQKTFDTREGMDSFWDWCAEAPLDHDNAYKKFELKFKPRPVGVTQPCTQGMDGSMRSQAAGAALQMPAEAFW